ncbi:hypothetical protein ACQPVA_15130 [Clostridium butyricum]|uniref:hypothetical protein n=1 Tax=Clostridium butyricum TaxID=1492 RepID=UPI003D32C19F
MKKKIKIGIAIIIAIIIAIPISLFMPLKNITTKIETTNGEKQELIDGDVTQIYAKLYPGITEGCWEVVGKDGVIFEDKSNIDTIKVTGEFPKKLNHDLTPNTIFVLNGIFESDKNRESWKEKGTFKVGSWSVLNSIERKEFKFLSKTSLTLWDYTSEDVIPLN